MKYMHIKHNILTTLWLVLSASLCANAAFAAPNLTLGSVTQALPGQVVNIPVTFDNDVTVSGLQFDVQYNASQLLAGSAAAGSVLASSGHGVSSSIIAADTLRVVITPPNDNAALSIGEIANLPWAISGSATGGPQPLTIKNVIYTSSSSNRIGVGMLNNGNIGINYPPIANNKTITTEVDQAVDGNLVATDNDNVPLTYYIVANPNHGTVMLEPMTGAFTYSPTTGYIGNDSFTFQVSDGKVYSNIATVSASITSVNMLPTANAGPDQTVNGEAAVTLIGSGTDNDGGIASYQWTQVGGTPVTLSGATTASASFTAPAVAGTSSLTFQLTVTDDRGGNGSDQVVVTVIPTGKPDLTFSAIGSPMSGAPGANLVVFNTVTNNGTADAEGNFDVGIYLVPEPVVFATDFESGTLEGWSTLKSGAISVVSDPNDGWVLKKTTNGDPNGGQAPLGSTVGDFELRLYTKRVTGTNFNRYSVTNSFGSGYGMYIDFGTSKFFLEKRASWTGTALASSVTLPGGAVANQWYTLQLVKQGTQLTARAYLGKVDPAVATPVATVTAVSSAYTSFTQVNVNGGYDYYTDNIEVVQLIDTFPTDGSEILLGKRTVFSLPLGASSAHDTDVTIPPTVIPGTYAVTTKADVYSTITESNETNNVLFGTKVFAVTAP